MTALAKAAPLAVHRSRKLIPDFRLHRPRTTAEAVAIKAAAGAGAVYMGGGIDVVNRMKSGFQVTDVIHLGAVAGLDGIEETDHGLQLSALVTHDRLATSPLVRDRLPALTETWPDVANIRIRCKGTIGGNIMAGDPSYDFALAALAANAQLHFLCADGREEITSGALPQPLVPDGLLTAIDFPAGGALRLVFDRSLRPILTLALGLDVVGDRITGGRVAVGGAHAEPLITDLRLDHPLGLGELARNAERVAGEVVAGLSQPLADHHATAAYRRQMIEVLLRRNLRAAP
jgi:aerobic carbon-monoxide dehydrogenase medium subunit